MLVPIAISKKLGIRKYVYVNPDYVESVQSHLDGSIIYMSCSDYPVISADPPDVVYGVFIYYEMEADEVDDD